MARTITMAKRNYLVEGSSGAGKSLAKAVRALPAQQNFRLPMTRLPQGQHRVGVVGVDYAGTEGDGSRGV